MLYSPIANDNVVQQINDLRRKRFSEIFDEHCNDLRKKRWIGKEVNRDSNDEGTPSLQIELWKVEAISNPQESFESSNEFGKDAFQDWRSRAKQKDELD